jgi:thiol-disulfide isomerase/thioredoxin
MMSDCGIGRVRASAIVIVAAGAMAGLSGSAWGQYRVGAPATAPATQPVAAAPATQPAVVDADALRSTLLADKAAFEEVLPEGEALTDAAARKASAAQVVPAAHKMLDDVDALSAADPEFKAQSGTVQDQLATFLALYGDAGGTARLAARANSKDPAEATAGRGCQLLAQWWAAAQDATAQAKVADQVETLAKAHPESDALTVQLATMSQLGAASPQLAGRVQKLVGDVMKNPTAEQMTAEASAQDAAAAKLAQLVNKPLTIAGPSVNGKPFTTADWKGKVILVDFWATWCGPCRAELPRVEKIYADYHAKGLEVLGVSNDQTLDDLTAFLAKDKAMPWPQLFDPTAAAAEKWNPITMGFGIDGIPTMFLIDRKGVCRSVTAREDMEQLIPKLLDEK